MYKTIELLCKAHRTRYYFLDGDGLTGVYNHAGRVVWYKMIPQVGYSLIGMTDNADGVPLYKLDEKRRTA